MAIDSDVKKFSATMILLPFRPAPVPDTTNGVGDMEMCSAGWMYAGITINVNIINTGFFASALGASMNVGASGQGMIVQSSGSSMAVNPKGASMEVQASGSSITISAHGVNV